MDSTFFGENTGLYFYSAVFQGNMALLALVGVFAVFRIQYWQNKADGLLETVAWYVADVLSAVRNPYPIGFETMQELDNCLKEILEKPEHWTSEHTYIRRLYEEDKHIIRWRDKNKKYEARVAATYSAMTIPLFLTALTIVVSLSFLMFARPLSLLSEFILFLSMIATTCLSLWALMANVSFVFAALDADIPRWARVFCCHKKESIRGGESPDSPRV